MSVTRSLEYEVFPARVDEAERILWSFLRMVRMNEPTTDYRVFTREDRCLWLHFATFLSHDAMRKHAEAPYTIHFEEAMAALRTSSSISRMYVLRDPSAAKPLAALVSV